jgi:hypothetical protein
MRRGRLRGNGGRCPKGRPRGRTRTRPRRPGAAGQASGRIGSARRSVRAEQRPRNAPGTDARLLVHAAAHAPALSAERRSVGTVRVARLVERWPPMERADRSLVPWANASRRPRARRGESLDGWRDPRSPPGPPVLRTRGEGQVRSVAPGAFPAGRPRPPRDRVERHGLRLSASPVGRRRQ